MDLTTFGKNPAAETLVRILNKLENKKISNKICSAVEDFRITVKGLKDVSDKKIRKKLLFLTKDTAKSVIENLDVPDEVKSYTLNVETGMFREALYEMCRL